MSAGPAAAEAAAASGVEPQARRGCLQAGPFAAAEARTAERSLTAALGAGGWSRRLPAGAGWQVVAGPYDGDAAVERKRAELERSGVAFEPLADLPAAMPGFTLGRHATRQAAAAALAEAARRGVRDARVVAVGDVSAVLLRVDGAAAAVRDRLARIAQPVGGVPLGQRFVACEEDAPAR